MSEHSLAPFGNRLIRPTAEDPRRAATKRAVSLGLVALVHLLFLGVLTFDILKDQRIGRKSTVETILDLSLLRNPNAPPVTMIQPQFRDNAPPEVSIAPITVPPPKIETPEQAVPPAKPGDVLKALGEELACGASSFENLTQQQRAKCLHQPWLERKLPDGTIVLLAPPKQTDQQSQIQLSGADQLRRDLQRSSPCPIEMQVPCVDNILHGRGGAPF